MSQFLHLQNGNNISCPVYLLDEVLKRKYWEAFGIKVHTKGAEKQKRVFIISDFEPRRTKTTVHATISFLPTWVLPRGLKYYGTLWIL